MQSEFDFIIIGAGSAGCVLASRLSEDATKTVLLVEAGPSDRGWRIRMPLAVDQLLNGTTYNWGFTTEPEPGLGGRIVGHPRGRVMGGTSSINGMVHTRGNPQDYDEWRDAHGCTAWGYADVLPYFRKMETAPNGGNRYRGATGPLKITSPGINSNPLNAAFIAAGRELGHPVSEDNNGAQHEGFGATEQTIWGGERQSTSRAYLTPVVRARRNLFISTKTLTERIIFHGLRAIGVVCSSSGDRLTFRARQEIILAAGAIGSPQLLKLSGVGPREELRRFGIEVVLDNPAVGANMQDHPDLAIQFACNQPVSLYRHTTSSGRILVGLNWFLFKRGVAASNQFEVAAYLRTRAGIKKPNLKLEFFPLAISNDNYKPYEIDAFQIHMTIMNASSRGQVLLSSANPEAQPTLKFNYLDSDADMATLREAVALTRELVASKAFAGFCGAEIEPGERIQSNESLDNWIRSRAYTAYHPSCTCRMGTGENCVVGPDLKVHGLENLRIADASIMPHIVTANTNATVIMIGERAADFCLGNEQLKPDAAPYWINPNWATTSRG